MKLAFAAATIAALALAAPASAASADRMKLAQADVSVRVGGEHDRGVHRERRMHREVRLHRDEGRHEGWRHSHHGKKVVIIKKHRHGATVIKKKVSHRD